MISFIICAASPALLENLRKNIHETTGVEFELIIVENYDNRYNIFQAYNIGVKRSQYSILCFLHEDVLFVTPGWGKMIRRWTTSIASACRYSSCPRSSCLRTGTEPWPCSTKASVAAARTCASLDRNRSAQAVSVAVGRTRDAEERRV